MPENNPGWRMKWFYAKDKSSAGEDFGLEEFRATTALRPRVSWRHELSEEEMKITEPLMEKIQQLRATPKKELSGIQLIRTFIERRVQPLAARAYCMWDYTDRRDPTRISSDELKEAEIDDDSVCAITNIKKGYRAENLQRSGLQQDLSPHRGTLFALAECLFCPVVLLTRIKR
jgi:hypothetical protein